MCGRHRKRFFYFFLFSTTNRDDKFIIIVLACNVRANWSAADTKYRRDRPRRVNGILNGGEASVPDRTISIRFLFIFHFFFVYHRWLYTYINIYIWYTTPTIHMSCFIILLSRTCSELTRSMTSCFVLRSFHHIRVHQNLLYTYDIIISSLFVMISKNKK